MTLIALAAPGGAAPAPNDPLYVNQWNLRTIGIPRAWDVSTGDGVVVAVLDTGVAYQDDGPYRRAPDLAGTRFVPGYDFVDNDDRPDDVAVPGRSSHGTHMAGTIAQTTNNGLGAAGIAPAAAIMPVRVLAPDRSGTPAAIAQGLRFAADHGANVANLSLGGDLDAPEVTDALRYAVGKGVTVIASAGEGGIPKLSFPGAYPEAIAVGAVRYDNTRAFYSNFGADLDLVAPGGDLQEDQNRDGLEDGITQQSLYGRLDSFCFCFLDGTSSAAAHVSGVAALVIASGRARTPAEVREVLLSSAADLGAPGRDDEYGAGLVQATRALGLEPLPGEVAPSVGQGPDPIGGIGTTPPLNPAITGPVTTGTLAPVLGEVRSSSDDNGAFAWLRRPGGGLGALAALVAASALLISRAGRSVPATQAGRGVRATQAGRARGPVGTSEEP